MIGILKSYHWLHNDTTHVKNDYCKKQQKRISWYNNKQKPTILRSVSFSFIYEAIIENITKSYSLVYKSILFILILI